MEKNPSQIGLEVELKAQYYLINQGWNVLVPLGNYLKYDLVIEKDNKFYRIQVKHAHCIEGEENIAFLVDTKYDKRVDGKVIKATYNKNDIDYFLTEYQGVYYMFPVFETKQTKFWLQERPPLQQSKKYAKDYKASDILIML